MIRPRYEYRNLSADIDVSAFRSTDEDLNDFLRNEAIDYQNEMLAETYVVVNLENREPIAFFSLLHDVIRFEKTDHTARNRINRPIPNSKRRYHYPAVKIGRLAVDQRYAGLGFGMLILDAICRMFVEDRRAGCRFLTVDALASATKFYQEKGGFQFFSDKDKDEDTRLMYFDLKTFR